MGNIENYYAILGVSNNATFDEIKEAFRKKVKEVHPDKEKGSAEEFTKVKEAYEVLKNDEKRKKYDELLFKRLHDMTKNNTKEANFSTNPGVTVIHIRKNHRKRISLSTVTINAALIMIGILGNRYLKK